MLKCSFSSSLLFSAFKVLLSLKLPFIHIVHYSLIGLRYWVCDQQRERFSGLICTSSFGSLGVVYVSKFSWGASSDNSHSSVSLARHIRKKEWSLYLIIWIVATRLLETLNPTDVLIFAMRKACFTVGGIQTFDPPSPCLQSSDYDM